MEGKKHTAGKARTFPLAFKEAAARRLLSGASGTALSRELGGRRSVLYRWRDALRAEGVAGLSRQRGRPAPGHGPPPKVPLDSRDRRIAELERLVLLQTSRRTGFFRTSLARLTPRHPGPRRAHREHIYSVVEQDRAQGSLSVEHASQLGGVNRAGFYRRFALQSGAEYKTELRDRIQRMRSATAATATAASPPRCAARAWW